MNSEEVLGILECVNTFLPEAINTDQEKCNSFNVTNTP